MVNKHEHVGQQVSPKTPGKIVNAWEKIMSARKVKVSRKCLKLKKSPKKPQNGCTKKNNVQEMVHSECRNTPSKASCAGSETILDFVKRTPRGSLVR